MKEKNRKSHQKKSFNSIKVKVSLLCTIFILIAVSINYILLLSVSKKTINSNTEETMIDLATAYSKNITDTVSKISETANFLKFSDYLYPYIQSNGTENETELEEAVTMFLSMNSSDQEVSIVNADGAILYSSNSSLIGTDISKESYFTDMVSSGTSTQSNVYTSASTGESFVTFAIPLNGNDAHITPGMPSTTDANAQATTETADTNSQTNSDTSTATTTTTENADASSQSTTQEFTGAITIAVNVTEFSNALSGISVGNSDSSYAYLLDSNGSVIYHPTEDIIGTKLDISALKNVVSKIQEDTIPEADVITYNYNGVEKYASYHVNSNNQWILVITAEKSEIFSSLNRVSTQSLYISIIIIILLALLSYLFATSITKPIKKITAMINQTADLDFTIDTSSQLIQRKDETGEMSRAIEKMRTMLKNIILQVSDASTNITQSADNLSNITHSVNDHASDNSATAEELSASMEETAATTEYICTNIDKISINTKDINDKISAGTQLSTELMQRAIDLKSSTTDTTKRTHVIYNEVREKTNTAIEQSKAVDKINIMTNTIKDIASQTSLLALNASIEAARAGEAGRGFSVVANEIGHLADQSTKTVSSITDIVVEVYQAVENMTKSMEQTLNYLENTVLTDYEHFIQVSEQYNSDAVHINNTLEGIQNEVVSLNTNMLNISGSISEINTMINEASNGVADVSEKNTDIVTLTTNTYNMVKQSTDYAASLQEIVNKFKL